MCDECTGQWSRRDLLRSSAAVGAFMAIGGGIAGAAAPTETDAVAVSSDLSVYPRHAWALDGPTASIESEDVRFLLVHHTAGSAPARSRVPDELRAIHRFHTGPERGWPDVAYNFLVDPYGGVWEGRAGSLNGAVRASATGGNQGYAQLVCLLGDFTAQLPTDAAIDALTRTLVWLGIRFGLDLGVDARTRFISRGSNRWSEGTEVDAHVISGHRDMSYTACPGDTFYPYLTTSLRADVAAAANVVPPSSTPTATGTDEIGQVETLPPLEMRPTSPPSEAHMGETTTSVASNPTETTGEPGNDPTVDLAAARDLSEGSSRLPWVAGGAVVGAAAVGWVAQRRRKHDQPEQDP